MKRRHTPMSRGIAIPRICMTTSNTPPAISVRAAISVTGGIVATPILMNV